MIKKEMVIASVQAYLNKAHHFLTQAEELADKRQAEGEEVITHCEKALLLLFKAFLMFKGEKTEEGVGIDQLYSRCASLAEDFYALEETIAYLTVEENLEELDQEELGDKVDAVNEVWDFVLSFLPEKYHL